MPTSELLTQLHIPWTIGNTANKTSKQAMMDTKGRQDTQTSKTINNAGGKGKEPWKEGMKEDNGKQEWWTKDMQHIRKEAGKQMCKQQHSREASTEGSNAGRKRPCSNERENGLTVASERCTVLSRFTGLRLFMHVFVC